MIRTSEEVGAALAAARPVVALESSVVAQGLPPPRGVEAALACEAAIRSEGAIPATIAVIDGTLVIGASSDELERLAAPGAQVAKAGARDLAPLLAAKASAGTTVSATVYAAAQVGIRLFATGGIGGVHRGAPFDVSSDLGAIASHQVAVVSAGAKAILDLPATLETLETLGVPVIGLGVDELPAFYCNESGLRLEHVARDAEAAARILDVRWRGLGQQGGVLLAHPVPAESALPADRVEAAIAVAQREAEAMQVRGKALTPFLLGRLAADAALGAVETNVALLVSNAAAAARVAVALAGQPPGSSAGDA